MNDQEYSIYRLGREARRFGYGRNACNIPSERRINRGWWMAGWHDEDMQIETLTKAGISA